MFLSLLFLDFHSFFLHCPSLLSHFLSLFYLSLGDDTKWPTRVDVSLNPNTILPYRLDSGSCLIYGCLNVVNFVSYCQKYLYFMYKVYVLIKSAKGFFGPCRRTRNRDHSIPSQTLELALAQPNVMLKKRTKERHATSSACLWYVHHARSI